MKKIFLLFLAVLPFFLSGIPSSAPAQEIDTHQLLVEIDDNLWSETKFIVGRLIIDNGRRERVMESETWLEGVEKSFSLYKSPPREKGTKMLKIKNKMWLYTPRTDRKILIAGHLLRQSMFGSDLSYEDMLEDRKLSTSYKAEVENHEMINGIQTLVLKLFANDPKITYQVRRIWVDVDKKIIYREERYAKGGQLLKRVDLLDYRPLGKRLFPRKMVFRDMLKENTKTTYIFDQIDFDINIPRKYFSQSILKR
ncbi:MAG: outer membrane lipoprotein-sorting protein [Nitrospinales bacterium]